MEAGLVRCSGAILLLGTQGEPARFADSRLRFSKLTNDLSLMMRESCRKNRELKEANETIERLARTERSDRTGQSSDAATRPSQREIARAER